MRYGGAVITAADTCRAGACVDASRALACVDLGRQHARGPFARAGVSAPTLPVAFSPDSPSASRQIEAALEELP